MAVLAVSAALLRAPASFTPPRAPRRGSDGAASARVGRAVGVPHLTPQRALAGRWAWNELRRVRVVAATSPRDINSQKPNNTHDKPAAAIPSVRGYVPFAEPLDASAHSLRAALTSQVAPPSLIEVGLGKLLAALADIVAPAAFATFGVYFMRSNLSVGLGSALRSADVLVTASLGFAGWLFKRYLNTVNKRFDKVDKRIKKLDKRFDKTDESLGKVLQLLETKP
jgi:hypothetical protein